MLNKNIIIRFLLLLIPFFSFANEVTLKNVHNDWPYKMNSNKAFDIASKCEMLVFIEVFNMFDGYSDAVLQSEIGAKSFNKESINTWKKETKKRIFNNFKKLSEVSLIDIVFVKKNSSWEVLSAYDLENQLPQDVLAWYKETKVFYRDYVKEQMRLAALYPRITSEILQFSENEIQGHNLSDKNFLLTFDDGPTVVNGNTDKLIKVLNSYQLTGMFFVLGDNLEKRLNASSKENLISLYGDNKVFSHGKVHKSHQKYSEWKTSIDFTNTLIHNIFPTDNKENLIYFRPPYGQRNKNLVDYFSEKKSKIIFWNIDSRDWSSKLNVAQVANRQIKLMLLWRNGILLFHDIHSKVQKTIPIIHDYFKETNIIWMKPNDI